MDLMSLVCFSISRLLKSTDFCVEQYHGKFMAILWNAGGDSISIKTNTTIGYLKESDYVEKSINLKNEKLQILKQNYNYIVSRNSSNIGWTHVEEMVIERDPELPLEVTKPYPQPLKHYKFVKGEIANLLDQTYQEINKSLCYTWHSSSRKV